MLPEILIVDDDKPSAILIEHYLKDIGILNKAPNGEIALEMIKNNNYDLILMDINLRGELDGLSLTKYVRQMDHYKEIPIIAITAFGKYYKDDAFAAGCNYFLIKPFEKKDFLELVSKTLRKDQR
ncbi:MAG: response regulator [Ignavibacteriaceae bacterium]